MKRWQTAMVRVCLILLAAVPAYCQRGTFGVDVGETADRFGALTRYTGVEGIIDGELIVWKSSDKLFGADLVAGGEVRLPADTNNHAKEYAVYGGPSFRLGKSWSIGFHGQVRRIYLPPSMNIPPGIVTETVFYRPRLSLLEVPGFVQYKFGQDKRWFVRAEGGPEFNPHYRFTVPTGFPNPNLDHGYTMRGSVGYVFGKWYLKGTYETRYFKFRSNFGNPGDFYNWRSDMVTGGIGFAF